MAKTQKSSEEEKIVKENVEKRFKNMFSGKNEPLSNLSVREVEALQARVEELEAQLEGRQVTTPEPQPVTAPMETMPPRPSEPATEPMSTALQKRIGLWATGISAGVGLAFFVVALYIVFGLQDGMWELSDQVLLPYTFVMFVASSIGWNLVRQDRYTQGVWMSYLSNVILAPVLVVLVIKNFPIIMLGYLGLFAVLFITLILPKPSKLRAFLTALGAALLILGIELWNPAFRLSTSHIQNFTWMVLGPAAVGIVAIFFMTSQMQKPRLQTRLTALIIVVILPMLLIVSILVISIARSRIVMGAQTELQGTGNLVESTVSTWLELNLKALQGLTLQPDIISMDAEQQRPVLQAVANAYPYMYLISTTDLTGMNVARNDDAELTDYSDRDWFKGASRGAPVTYQTLIGRSTGQPALVISMPIKNASGKIVGVMMFAADLTDLVKQTQVSMIGEGGFSYVVDVKNQALAHPNPTYTAELRDMSDYPPVAALRQGQSGAITFTDEDGVRWRAYGATLENGWAVFAQRPESEIFAPANQLQTVIVILMLAVGAVMLVLTWLSIRRTLQPIAALTETISAISAGDLNRVAEVKSQDEIGVLAHTFNTMTSQLRNMVGSLEQRVADRTRALELAAEVGRTVSEKLQQQTEMLTEAVELIRARFNLYYTQVYLTEPGGERLILYAGTGEAGKELLGRGHNLIINSGSLNGRAVLEKRAQIVPDTAMNPTFLPNPLLPSTRSEMCIPLIVGENVVGVLDMQSDQPGALSENNLPAFQALAGQLAVAVRNAALFTEVIEARAQVEGQMRRFTEQGWRDFLDAIHQKQRIGFAFDANRVSPVKPEMISTSSGDDALNLPIQVAGAKVGAIQLPHALKASEVELVKSVSDQLAQHVENLRLLAQAETFREEAEQAVRRLTHEGWEGYLDSSRSDAGYVYDLNEVTPLSENNHDTDPALTQPIVIGGESIGELKLNVPDSSEDTIEIVSAVAQQLSSHLETLRLSDLNERHAQREQTLRQLTSALRSSTDPATIMRTAVREVGRILGRKALVQVIPSEQLSQSGENSPADRS